MQENLHDVGIFSGVITGAEIASSLRGRGYYRCKVRITETSMELFLTISGIYTQYCLIKLGLPETDKSARDNVGKLVGTDVKVKVTVDKAVDDPSVLFNHVQLLELVM